MQFGINQLEEMFAKNKLESKALRQLADELQYRTVPKAATLLSHVQSALRATSQSPQSLLVSSAVIAENSNHQPELWSQPMSLDKFSDEKISDLESLLLLLVPPDEAIGNVSLRSLLAEHGWDDEQYWAIRNRLIDRGVLETGRGRGGSVRRASGASTASPTTTPVTVANPAPPAFPASKPAAFHPASVVQTVSAPSSLKPEAVLPLEDAYRILRVAPTSTWEVIELARRQLVQQASPIKTATMNVEKRSQLQEQAHRANLACHSIWRNRIGVDARVGFNDRSE
jgi:hypothetical protein